MTFNTGSFEAGKRASLGLPLAIVAWLVLNAASCSSKDHGQGIAGGTAESGELRAQRLVIVDADGAKCAELGPAEGGGTMVTFYAKDGSQAAQLGTQDGTGPFLHIGDAGGHPMVEFGISERGGPVFMMRDVQGRRRAAILTTKAGSVGFALCDEAGVTRCSLGLATDGAPFVDFCDRSQARRASLAIRDGLCVLDLADAKQRRITLEVDEQGKATIALLADGERAVWSQTVP